MADYQLREHEGAVQVSIVGYDGPRLPLLEAFQEHRGGRRTSPTDTQAHLDTLDADEQDGRIELTLTPKAGARLDLEVVRRCLEDTFERFEGVSL